MARQRGFTTHLLMLVIVLALASSCGSGRSESSSPVRLVDGFTRDVVSGTPASSVRHDGSPEFELYDVGADPLDLSAEHPDVVERLARTIDR